MRYKQLILKKIFELNNLLNVQRAMLSDNRPREEFVKQIEKQVQKVQEMEVLINTEQESF
jgi:hypothetical protein